MADITTMKYVGTAGTRYSGRRLLVISGSARYSVDLAPFSYVIAMMSKSCGAPPLQTHAYCCGRQHYMLTTTMPTCAARELCKALSKELHGNSGHACRAGCGGRGICGEVEDPEGNEMNRICLRCVGKRKKGKEKSSNQAENLQTFFCHKCLHRKKKIIHYCSICVWKQYRGHNNTLLPRSWVNTCCFSAYSALSSVIARLSSLFKS